MTTDYTSPALTVFVLLVVLGVIAGAVWFVYKIWTATPTPPAASAIDPDENPLEEVPEDRGKLEQITLDDRRRVDLQALPNVTMTVRGDGNWIGYGVGKSATYSSPGFALLREPGNRHDANAVAVHHPNGRKIGYISATRAAGMAPILDRIGPAAFIVSGGFDDGRLRVNLPTLPALRAFAKSSGAS